GPMLLVGHEVYLYVVRDRDGHAIDRFRRELNLPRCPLDFSQRNVWQKGLKLLNPLHLTVRAERHAHPHRLIMARQGTRRTCVGLEEDDERLRLGDEVAAVHAAAMAVAQAVAERGFVFFQPRRHLGEPPAGPLKIEQPAERGADGEGQRERQNSLQQARQHGSKTPCQLCCNPCSSARRATDASTQAVCLSLSSSNFSTRTRNWKMSATKDRNCRFMRASSFSMPLRRGISDSIAVRRASTPSQIGRVSRSRVST